MAEELKYPATPNNPYDYIGSAHNFFVSTLIKKYGDKIKEAGPDYRAIQDAVLPSISEIASANLGDVDLSPLTEVPGSDGVYANIDFNNYTEIINRTSITDEAKARINNYLAELYALPLNSNEEVNRFTGTVIEYENAYKPADEATDSIVLSVLAIAKYSAYFWQDLQNSGNTAGRVAQPQQLLKVRWGCVAGDIAGGCIAAFGSSGLATLAGAAAGSAIVYYCFYG